MPSHGLIKVSSRWKYFVLEKLVTILFPPMLSTYSLFLNIKGSITCQDSCQWSERPTPVEVLPA